MNASIHTTLMKLFITSVIYFLIATLLLTCRRAEVEPDRLLDGTPRLKSISFTGIPQENVSIDQKDKIITVKMPSIIPDKISIKVELTDNAEWVNTYDYASGIKFGYVKSFGFQIFQIILKDKTDLNNMLDRSTYTIKTIATGPIKIGLITKPLSYTIEDSEVEISIPMINLYGNIAPRTAYLTNLNSQEKTVLESSSRDIKVYFSSNPNNLGISLYYEKLIPGVYRIDLLLMDGTLLNIPQPLTIYAGKAQVGFGNYYYGAYRGTPGKTITFKGANLFEGNFTFELIDRYDKAYPLPNLTFERYGQQVQLTLPVNLTPDQYVLRASRKGVDRLHCLLMNIVNDERKSPYIGTLVGDSFPCSLRDPIAARRGVKLPFSSDQTKQSLDIRSLHLTFKLLPASGNTSYNATIVPYDLTRGEFLGTLTIPITVPPGLYTATLQVLDAQNNVVEESEPYGRVLNVQ